MLEQLLRVGPRSRWLNKGVCDKRRHELARLKLAQVPLRTCKVARTKNPAPLGRIHTGPKQRSGGNENLAVPLNRVHIGRLPFRWPHRIRIRALQIGLTHSGNAVLRGWRTPVRSSQDICSGPHRVGLRKYAWTPPGFGSVSSTQPGGRATHGFKPPSSPGKSN